ncbi:TetR/AcrR family transcriptional regulator [Phycicoccus sp. CSK15P-2]|uniref:TetR/AcrR family transcriptional regulator n=1 Tax=Phycicoccus sp. CSK15P-2 TaxID=2807627 RepID=UPI00194DF9C3|nr:TetR/AcrR family transcriptional regulator [Phycicoccus sp. CSK15P-2]MBM6404208.1 TetR/AcrR family transcriptional regulator [Phycicoccus sp. CSK15P-2]
MPRAGLTPTTVARTARRLVDERGVPALTMSAVAAELGVAPPSLYKHVDGLEDLLGLVAVDAADQLARDLGDAVRGLAGRDALAALAHAYRAFARSHPGSYPLTQHRVAGEEFATAAARVLDCITAALAGYGAAAVDEHHVRVLRSSLHGFVDIEAGGGFALPVDIDDSFAVLVDSLDALLRAAASR